MTIPKQSVILLCLLFLIQISYSQHSSEWESGPPQHGGNYNMKIRNSGPSKIFEWIGSRFSKLPSLLPRFPQFPKYETSHKMPSYQVVIPQPPADHYSNHGDEGEEYSGPQGSHQDHFGGEEHEGIREVKGQDEPPANSGNHGNYQQEPVKYPQNYQSNFNQIPHQGPPLDKVKESPIDIFPSKMVMYEKETYPPQGQGAGWQDAVPQAQQHAFQGPPQNFAPPKNNYAPPPKENYPPPQNYVQQQPEQNYLQAQPSHQNYAPPQQNYAPPQHKYKGQGSKEVVKQVPFTPQSTGPDYFNTAYYHEGKFQTEQASAVGDGSASFGTFGAAYTSAQQPHQHAPPSNHGFNQQDFSSLLTSIDQTGGNPYAHLNFPQAQAQPTNSVPQYHLPPGGASSPTTGGAKSYIPLSPGVKVLQSQHGGNSAFEVIADANAPTYNGHPFDLSKLISMIEPGAQLVEAPRPSQDATPEGSENTRLVTSVTSGGPVTSDTQKTGSSSDIYFSTNPTPLNSGNGTPDLIPSLSDLDLDFSRNTSTNIKDIMTFFQQTNGKGYVVVEKKGPTDPLDPDLFDLEIKNELNDDRNETQAGTKLNITADNFKYLFDANGSRDTLAQDSFSETVPQHPNHNYNEKGSGDLDFADSNISSIAITVTPPSTTTNQNLRKQYKVTTTTSRPSTTRIPQIVNQSVSTSVSSSKMRPAPVYKKKSKMAQKGQRR